MLTRIAIDNYRCFTNFELRPGPVQLVIGGNGVGKTTLFDVLFNIQGFSSGEFTAAETFGSSTLTRWGRRNVQRVELDFSLGQSSYRYELEVVNDRKTHSASVQAERLFQNGTPLLNFEVGESTPSSPLSRMCGLQQAQPVRDWLDRCLIVELNPFDIQGVSDRAESRPMLNMRNFVNWYRHLCETNVPFAERLQGSLQRIWPTFVDFCWQEGGAETRYLTVRFASGDPRSKRTPICFHWHELTSGQYTLIVLYAALAAVQTGQQTALWIDEPVNFVTPSEIQPWLSELVDTAEDRQIQVVIASHHPELINFLAPERAIVLHRPHGGATQAAPFHGDPASTLTPAEIVSRGWEHE